MSHLDLTGCKKRRRGERIFRFKTFCEQGYPVEFHGPFRQNVKALLGFGHLESNLYSGMPSWSFQLEVHRHPPVHILLCVVEEPIEQWLVLAAKGNSDEADIEKGKSNLVEVQGHVMHGVFHSNGFGHLLCVNGLEMGSDLSGYQIMEFWDRLCTGLRARKVSLNDTSRKTGMDLRLLHGIAYSESWFGRWGYKMGRGTFGVTQPMYQVLSDHSLVTLSDLFRFMLELKSSLPKETCVDSFNSGILVETTCRWSAKRVEMATRVIVEALRRAEFRWVSRQVLRDAARAYIGDTGLLDFVLKSLGNHIVGNYLVRRSLNPVTKVLEYCLEDISNAFPHQEGNLVMGNPKANKARYKITRAQLMKDLFYLYKNILKEQKSIFNTGIFMAIPMAARIILDTKYLIKEYCGEPPLKVDVGLEEKSKVYCTVMLRNHDEAADEVIKKAIMPPYECVILKNNATIDELILEVEKCFREMYWGLKNFVVDSIVNLNANGSDAVFSLVESGCKLVFEGIDRGRGKINEGIYESSQNNRVVDCPCGAKDDDGERMVSCDICEVWQHTRCVRIPNNEEIPHIFLCNRCEQDIKLLPSLP
ncbi:hypothetical protein L1049_007029 [Liquidambar formosana]|uniref:Zinc finger PHD-type domain-containing protein n=1 Tax=Liquidambar formosana TaxID=63359 RepID=A0AAP0RGI5_LIQFO